MCSSCIRRCGYCSVRLITDLLDGCSNVVNMKRKQIEKFVPSKYSEQFNCFASSCPLYNSRSLGRPARRPTAAVRRCVSRWPVRRRGEELDRVESADGVVPSSHASGTTAALTTSQHCVRTDFELRSTTPHRKLRSCGIRDSFLPEAATITEK